MERDSRNDFLTTDDLFVSRPLSLGERLQQFEAGAFVTATNPQYQFAGSANGARLVGRKSARRQTIGAQSRRGHATVDRGLRVLDLRPDRLKWRAC